MQVADETDRLLRQEYHGWLPRLVQALGHERRVVKLMASATLTQDPAKLAQLHLHGPRCALESFDSQLENTCARAVTRTQVLWQAKHARAQGKQRAIVRVVIFRFVSLGSNSSNSQLAASLLQQQVTTSASHKPHAIVALLAELCLPSPLSAARDADEEPPKRRLKAGLPNARGIVFAGSVESTHRLALLLRHCKSFLQLEVLELSSSVDGKAQKQAAQRFRSLQRRCALCTSACCLQRGRSYDCCLCGLASAVLAASRSKHTAFALQAAPQALAILHTPLSAVQRARGVGRHDARHGLSGHTLCAQLRHACAHAHVRAQGGPHGARRRVRPRCDAAAQ